MRQTDLTASVDDLPGPVVLHSPLGQSRPAVIFEFTEPVPYPDAWNLQKRLHDERVVDHHPDTLLLLEHVSVYTAGRTTQASHRSDGENNLRRGGLQIHSVDRGGSLTYHGPGQLVGYPIIRLAHYASGPRQYVRLLEDVIIETLRSWRIKSHRIDKKPGVWVQLGQQEAKIAAIGVRIERGVTLHGFALNVEMDLSPYSRIAPCGLAGCRVTSMAETLGSTVPLPAVRSALRETFAQAFGIEWISVKSGPLAETIAPR